MRFLGYDRKSSGSPWQREDREESLRALASREGYELAGVLVHIARKRDDCRRFTEIRRAMEDCGAEGIFTPWEDRLAPWGWNNWPGWHPLIQGVLVETSQADKVIRAETMQRCADLLDSLGVVIVAK